MSSKFFLILGPSGVGKGTLLKRLKEDHKEIYFAVSNTTRSPRPGEIEGETYHFVTVDQFEKGIQDGDFLEHACVHQSNYYGILKVPILKALAEGKTVIREVDFQGLQQIKANWNYDYPMISVFFLPPPWSVLKKRIMARAPISEEELKHREESLSLEMQYAPHCDVQMPTVDGDIEASYQNLLKVIFN